jgi:hypothetical protein
MSRPINAARWERDHPAEARILRSMEGKTLAEMAQATGVREEATRLRCKALGIKYSLRAVGCAKVSTWRPPEQYPSVFHFAHGVTLRHMQGARS